MKMCRLKNNSVEPLIIVKTTMININSLTKMNETNPNESMQNMLAVYELGKIAHDSSHKLFSENLGTILQGLCLLSEDGTMNRSVKNIAQSAISFEGEFPVVENPIVEILGIGASGGES